MFLTIQFNIWGNKLNIKLFSISYHVYLPHDIILIIKTRQYNIQKFDKMFLKYRRRQIENYKNK